MVTAWLEAPASIEKVVAAGPMKRPLKLALPVTARVLESVAARVSPSVPATVVLPVR